MVNNNTTMKVKAGRWDSLMAFAKNPIVLVLLAGGMGGGASTGIIGAMTPTIPVPAGVATEAALSELKAAFQTLQQTQAVYQAETTANMKALTEAVANLRQDFRDYKKDGK
jgi:hypothetical protein